MILHPALIALLLGEAVVCALLLGAAATAVAVLRRWDFASASGAQLALERRTPMVATLAAFALGLQAASLPLLLSALERIHPLFTGAMCATGSLNANPIGWWVLLVKIALLVLSALWLALHRLDVAAPDFPLVRPMSVGVLLLAPLALLDFGLLAAYLGGLDPQVITSCCGSLFSEEGGGVASGLAGLPPGPMRVAFFSTLGGMTLANRLSRGTARAWPRLALGVLSLAFLPLALASVVSFLSVGVYQLPTHHCPFDLIQREYGFVGYPLYLSIFGASVGNLLPAIGVRLRRHASLRAPIARAEAAWLRLGLISALLCAGLSAWPTVVGLRLE